MSTGIFPLHEGLAGATRVPALGRRAGPRISTLETAVLLLAGGAAAVPTASLRLGLRIPGHAIVLAVLPLACGLALVPRRGAGSIMAVGAGVTAAWLRGGGHAALGAGALTSLCATGPLLDLALAWMRSGWRLYGAFVAAGLTSNLLALVARGGVKLGGFDAPGMRPMQDWWPRAGVTYLAAGAVAGLISAAIWFSSDRRRTVERG